MRLLRTKPPLRNNSSTNCIKKLASYYLQIIDFYNLSSNGIIVCLKNCFITKLVTVVRKYLLASAMF